MVPFFAFFLAGMNLVVLADDAFTFLVSWEFMSLVSWALVMAHHRVPENARAGYLYIVMASFGTFALLLAFGNEASPIKLQPGEKRWERIFDSSEEKWQGPGSLLPEFVDLQDPGRQHALVEMALRHPRRGAAGAASKQTLQVPSP